VIGSNPNSGNALVMCGVLRKRAVLKGFGVILSGGRHRRRGGVIGYIITTFASPR
jgi:hypothetical protein